MDQQQLVTLLTLKF